MAIDNKYGHVTVEHGDIDDDEVVVVFRAQDMHLTQILDTYHAMCFDSPEHHRDAIMQARGAVVEWQEAHPDRVRIPNSDKWVARMQA